MIGRKIANYEVLEKLGEGGMGVVYKARDLRLGRPVALKFLPSHLARSAEQLARFDREARAISALNHPNIATIHGMEEAGQESFLVLEYLPGGTLRDRIDSRKTSGEQPGWEETIDLAIQAAEGLAHAHANGIVHRDVKADNLMFTADGRVKVTDFGLARFSASRALTRDGSRLGTAAYMSPEQAQGMEVDHRTDIFSFGVVLYEMTTGRLPFEGEHEAAILYETVNTPSPPVRQSRPDVPEALERIVSRALEKKREDRYQDVSSLASDLRAVRNELATGPTPAPRVLPRWARFLALRRAWLSAVVVALLLALAALTGRSLVQRLFMGRVPAEKQLAVLPFLNVGGDAAQQAFCDGLVETLASKLTQLEQFQGSLWVVPSSEVRHLGVTSAGEARKAFGATLVLTGSIQRAGERVRLTANVVETARLRQLRTLSLDTRLDNIALLQDGIVARVAEMLEVSLDPRARRLLVAGGTAVPGAYDLYLQGRGLLGRYDRIKNLSGAIALFEKALEQDPAYALAHAGLGEAYWRMYHSGSQDPKFLEQARASLKRAIALNDQAAPAHAILGLVHTSAGENQEAIQELRRALAIDPASAEAHRGLAAAYEALGQYQEAEKICLRAVQLRPGYWSGYNVLGVFYTNRGRYAEAEPLFRRVTELTPDNLIGYRNLGGVYIYLGQYEAAAKVLEKAVSIRPTPGLYSNLGTAYFAQKRYTDAVQRYEKAVALGTEDYRVWGNLGQARRWAPEHRARASQAYRHAIELARQRLAVNPKDAACRASLAVFWVAVGQRGKGLAELRQATQLAPEDLTVLFKAAEVYELTGQRDRALEALEAAVRRGYSIHEVRSLPELAELRTDPRYQKRMAGLPLQSTPAK